MDCWPPALTPDERAELDTLLLQRLGDDADLDHYEGGVLGVCELDGFLTAIVSGPVAVEEARWLAAIWGAYEPPWDSAAQAQRIVALLRRHGSAIAAVLAKSPDDFQPIFGERQGDDGSTQMVVDEWCEGYLYGLSLDAEAWAAGEEELDALLLPILTFGSDEHGELLDGLGHDEVRVLMDMVPEAARDIHQYWAERRMQACPAAAFAPATEPVGGDDLCPCGSGRERRHCRSAQCGLD